GACVVANRCEDCIWTGRLAPLLFPRENGLYRLRRPDTGRDDQLRGEAGKSLTQTVVRGVVQPDAVLLPILPAIGRNGVEARCVLAQRLQEGTGLFGCWAQSKPDSPLHVHVVQHFAKRGKRRLLPR